MTTDRYHIAPNSMLATEYGHLDAKRGIGYDPRPFGFERDYADGYLGFLNERGLVSKASVPPSTYADPTNWGWY